MALCGSCRGVRHSAEARLGEGASEGPRRASRSRSSKNEAREAHSEMETGKFHLIKSGMGEEEGHRQVIDLQVQGKKSVEVKFKLPAINMTLFSQKCMEDPTCSLDAAVKIPLQCRQAFYYPRADRES